MASFDIPVVWRGLGRMCSQRIIRLCSQENTADCVLSPPQSPGTIYTTHISYLEIYNESGYDLLDPKHKASKLEDLP